MTKRDGQLELLRHTLGKREGKDNVKERSRFAKSVLENGGEDQQK